MKQHVFNSILFLGVALAQISLLPHWSLVFPNILLIAVVLVNVLEPPTSSFGIVSAFLGGLFWDFLSLNLLGWGASTLVILALLIKIGKHSYVRVPFFS